MQPPGRLGERPPLRDHPRVHVLAGEPAHRNDTPVPVAVALLAGNRPPCETFAKRTGGSCAAPPSLTSRTTGRFRLGGINTIEPDRTLFEETLYDANPDENLHVMLRTLGGDGETALRLVRQAQSRCKELTVIVPVEAKSAGTLFVLGAERVLMGPTSDLGPIDPQFRLQSGVFASGKAIIAAVEDAERRIQANPETYPLHASLLNDITALLVQQANGIK